MRSELKSHYLPFVDGLRAISILAVVACHAGVPGFSGGFVGVDVFFVISGFLIVGQIRDGLEGKNFSWVMFYARRGLRILPPFIAMLLTVYFCAPFFLPNPDVYFDFILSAVFSPAMLSNVLFYKRQGYFDVSANEKPLLHTWTLSVEEQFYLIAPIILMLIFRIGRGRFGGLAFFVAAVMAAVSLAGCVAFTSVGDNNAAFYLTQWRIWEFIIGGIIFDRTVMVLKSAPRALLDPVAVLGICAIFFSIAWFDNSAPYPSWRAVFPVFGAALVIACSLREPNILIARFLALPWMVGIGLLSYGWYLWHWPIIAFLRISRMDEASVLPDLIGGGVGGLLIAAGSYFFLEAPIRKWRKAGIERPWRVFLTGVSACTCAAIIGGLAGFGGYEWISHYIESAYGTEGKGSLDNGCRLITMTSIPAHCLQGHIAILLGDSHADTMFGSLARNFQDLDLKLIYVGRGGCDPLHFATSERKKNRTHGCANLLAPFEQLLESQTPVRTVVVTPTWLQTNDSRELWSELISQFGPLQTRILVVAPAPKFRLPALDCVLLGDRYGGGRDRCTSRRADVENDRAQIVEALRDVMQRYQNVRLIDPIDLFCDDDVCRPFEGDRVYFSDQSHLETSGTDKVFDHFEADFRWVGWRD
jgi:peptidoglycan/LPS O-acetylase OafA/YrhL